MGKFYSTQWENLFSFPSEMFRATCFSIIIFSDVQRFDLNYISLE